MADPLADIQRSTDTSFEECRHTKPGYRLIDAFCGAGGMTLGFTQAFDHNFVPVWANDNDQAALQTYGANFGDAHCHLGDIVELLADGCDIPSADVVIGGPPCQGFSLLNRNREGDPRRQLWRPFLEIVKRSGADVFVIENVPGLLGSPEEQAIIDEAHRLGFRVTSEKLCAADYGVAQVRWRAFIIGCRHADPSGVFPPAATHADPRKPFGLTAITNGDIVHTTPLKWETVENAISDLPEPEGYEIRDVEPPLDLHFGRRVTDLSKRRYEAVPDQGMNRFDLAERAPHLNIPCWTRRTDRGGTDLFGRLWWDRPSSTIRTEFMKPEKGRYLHPEQHRALTHREAARLQSFPDSFRFRGKKIEIARQIGNAVPPLMAARIADCVRDLLSMRPAAQRHNCTVSDAAGE